MSGVTLICDKSRLEAISVMIFRAEYVLVMTTSLEFLHVRDQEDHEP